MKRGESKSKKESGWDLDVASPRSDDAQTEERDFPLESADVQPVPILTARECPGPENRL